MLNYHKKIKKDKQLTILVNRLKRVFPKLEMIFPTELFGDCENECVPEYNIDWYDVIEKLKENGLEIKNIK